ncbi:DUF1906 domain-containing protein [Streptomyces sp. SP17BM10]|uniref:DUF1906 domain-containing protein n=1 Tax=Streptomyces sp. SP17BM10 TaxID=3002530 RepID=UPI002E78FA8C|nr:DUF1906 domain-containing protein [Streptomyces sp. SP17BM10]MEE1783931.1 DUF1906 domain-containing protein [Streptomyces sp. SP17BM10]
MRYLRPTALIAAALVLLLATDGTGASAEATAPVAVVLPSIRPLVLPDLAGPPKVRDGFSGYAFDICAAPSLDTLKAWRGDSPYGALGIYTSGSQRACSQPRLTADWVRQARANGWRFLPVHVGPQAPCTQLEHKPKLIDPAHAADQGRSEASEAVRGLQALGFGPGNPVYVDIESYPPRVAGCGQAVIDFAIGWTQRLHELGYTSGFYSSLNSGISDLAAAAWAHSSPLPDAVWYAKWDGHADTDAPAPLGGDLWVYHQRIHQYQGNVQTTHGGVTLTVDRDYVDGPTAG